MPATRSPQFPDVPTLAEAGFPNHEVAFWVGFLVPAETRKERIDALHKMITKIQSTADVTERFAAMGFHSIASTPGKFAAYLKTESAEWAKSCRGPTSRRNSAT